MKTNREKNPILEKYLETLCKCYSAGVFDSLFPLMADDCVMESQWVKTPNKGKDAVIDYFVGKGETLRKNNCCPECSIIELIGNMNTIRNANISVNKGDFHTASVGLQYPDGKLAMYMSQNLEDKTNGVVVDLQLNNQDEISRIDLCIPDLFKFRFIRGRFVDGSEEIIRY